MQDRRQLCFILALLGAVFGLGSGAMTLLMSTMMFGMMPVFMRDAPLPMFLALFGWLSFTAIVGGVVTLVGALRMREATEEALRSAAMWALVGGCITVLGGNVLAAGLGIAAGAVLLSDAPPAQASA